jgi:Dolichyl-phosphate-mannose-protein mannosyltransferase
MTNITPGNNFELKGKMKQIKLIWLIIFIIGLSARSTKLFHGIDTSSWREADVSTIAKNFYQNGTDIFHPQIAWDGSGPGYIESEFPIYPYLISASYKIFGFWEPIGRVISFVFSLAAMLVFFRLSRYLLNEKAAIAASFFFGLSPILFVMSNAIQPESVMFFFYLCSGYTFIRWLGSGSKKYYWLTITFTALALLCKITAANIGILFLLLIIFKKGWKFLFKPKFLILGVLSIVPSILWYSYCHKFYILYGNSLGISNEHAWMGWDFFTKPGFIVNIVEMELFNVWTLSGAFIVILALVFTKLIKRESTVLAMCWLTAASFFYVIAARTTSQGWAYYYHIFSIPAASILVGSSVIELYDKYIPDLNLRKGIAINRSAIVKGRIIIFLLILLVSFFAVSCFNYLVKTKSTVIATADSYVCKDSLMKIIPQKSLLLTIGGFSKNSAGYPIAYNASYFFYWLDRKGYDISIEDLSIKNILSFKARGVTFFLTEEHRLQPKPGFKDELKRNFTTVYECKGCILFKL